MKRLRFLTLFLVIAIIVCNTPQQIYAKQIANEAAQEEEVIYNYNINMGIQYIKKSQIIKKTWKI